MKIIEVITKRKDTLIGCWYGEQYRDTCVIITNGTGGNIFENRFLRVLGDELEKENISYICAHNSGAFQIIDLPSENHNRSGLTFEMFDNCEEDLQAYVNFAKEQGYKKIILGGHSYGCNKVIYYLYKTNNKDIDKYILISPTDTEERTDGERISADKIQEIANEYKKQNKLDDIIPILYDEYNFYTAKSFIDAMENKNHHNLPIYNNKKGFNQLQSIAIKGLFVMGQKDGFAKQQTQRHLETINQYSKNKDNDIKVIENTGHTFRNKEVELSKAIIDFVKE